MAPRLELAPRPWAPPAAAPPQCRGGDNPGRWVVQWAACGAAAAAARRLAGRPGGKPAKFEPPGAGCVWEPRASLREAAVLVPAEPHWVPGRPVHAAAPHRGPPGGR
jgi:hypothetical protein